MLKQPQQIHRQRVQGTKIPPHTKVVSSLTRWANPWAIRRDEQGWYIQDVRRGAIVRAGSESDARELALMYFEDWVTPQASLVRQQLSGWNLACWCRPPLPCHVDVLLEIANPSLACEAVAG